MTQGTEWKSCPICFVSFICENTHKVWYKNLWICLCNWNYMIFDLLDPPQGLRGRGQKKFDVAHPIHVSNSHTKFGWISSNGLGGDSITARRTNGQTDGGEYNITSIFDKLIILEKCRRFFQKSMNFTHICLYEPCVWTKQVSSWNGLYIINYMAHGIDKARALSFLCFNCNSSPSSLLWHLVHILYFSLFSYVLSMQDHTNVKSIHPHVFILSLIFIEVLER